MRRHREEEHGADFRLSRDVSFAGNARATAPLAYIAPTAFNQAAFHCRDCQGRKFLLRDPFAGTPERRAHLRRIDRHLQALLAATAPEDHDALIDLYERRALGSELVAGTLRRDAQRTVEHRPETGDR
jgi:hypothetical protein